MVTNMNKLDDILTGLRCYSLKSIDATTKEYYAYYPELRKAKDELKNLMLEIVNNPYEMGITDLEMYEHQKGEELVVISKASLQRIVEQL